MLSVETPATLICFDLLADADGKLLTGQPLSERRSQLEGFFRHVGEPTGSPFAGFPE
jgi:ATP-dependent DNA ligase